MTHKIPIPFQNLTKHLENTFEPWSVKNPTFKHRLSRSIIFLVTLLLAVFWPMQNYLIINFVLLLTLWISLSLIKTKLPVTVTLLIITLSIAYLYYSMRFILDGIS